MHAIVNKLTLGKPFDEALLQKVREEFFPRAREHEGFLDCKVVRVSDTMVIIVALYASKEALDEVSSKMAGPWFAANVRPYLDGPVERLVGEVIAQAAP